MAMTAAMVNGVCAQPVQAADGEGLKVALLLSGAANDQGWNLDSIRRSTESL